MFGFTLTQFVSNGHAQLFGLGLMGPGAGFLAHAGFSSAQELIHLGTAVFGLLIFTVSVFVWFATGNVLAPPLIWLVLATVSATMNHGHLDPELPQSLLAAIAGLLCLLAIGARLCEVIYQKKRQQANEYLVANGAAVTAQFIKEEKLTEFSPADLRRMEFLLDRALQPLSDFNGFEWLDQFQTAAMRYQLNFAGYALSMAQATHLPAMKSYLGEAQRNLILKQTDYRVWRYWTIENLWGNLRYNPDPMAHENIMYTGFCSLQMSMYQKVTGQNDFEQKGSFTLSHPQGKTYAYDMPQLLDVLEREAKKSDFHLIACEPNWIYPLCNTIGASSVLSQDVQAWNRQEERFRNHMEREFIDLAGNFVPCRSRYTGFALPNIGGVMPQALPCLFLNAILPDIALRQWLLLRREMLKDGQLNRKKFWRIDTGNYGFSRAAAYAATALAATELGDSEIKNMCFQALDEECPVRTDDGYFYRPKASVWAHGVEFFARSNVKNGFRDLMHAEGTTAGPHISEVSYRDVIVASAKYAETVLSMVLYPRKAAGLQMIKIAGLVPQTAYLCSMSDAIVNADHEGKINLNIVVDGRTEIILRRKD